MNTFRSKWLVGAIALAFATQAGALSRLGDAERLFGFGKKAAEANREMTQEEEIELGRGLTARVLGAAPLVDDPELQRYVNRVGLWLAMQSERPDLPWRFGVISSADVNAFAMPGGTILITSGLYDRLRDEAELAGVLGHEIAHVVQKHQLAAIKKAAGRSLMADLAGEAVSRSGNTAVQMFGDEVFAAGMNVFAKGLDRKDEYDADQRGIVLAARGGYNPYGLVGVLQTLDGSGSSGGMALMLSTHPSPADRIGRLGESVGDRLDAYAATPTPARIYRPGQ
jgi:beta-barrel assembly-enhancing protease